MRRVIPAIVLVLLATTSQALADATATAPAPATATAPAPATATAPAPATATAPAPAPSGLAVVALHGATDAAWPLARAIYADPALRPAGVDEARARILCGEAAPPGAPPDLRDLADTVAALRGDDAPSRVILDGLARRFGAQGIVVVKVDPGPATAHVFVAGAGAFDAASYAPDAVPSGGSAAAPPAWSAATRSLDRAFGRPLAATPQGPAPALATHAAPARDAAGASPAHFYESGWFWGAIGLAALAGGAAFLTTRDSSSPTIHLEAQVPH